MLPYVILVLFIGSVSWLIAVTVRDTIKRSQIVTEVKDEGELRQIMQDSVLLRRFFEDPKLEDFVIKKKRGDK